LWEKVVGQSSRAQEENAAEVVGPGMNDIIWFRLLDAIIRAFCGFSDTDFSRLT